MASIDHSDSFEPQSAEATPFGRCHRGGLVGQRLPLLHGAQRPGGGGEGDPAEGAVALEDFSNRTRTG